jgi:hypothetical protein
MKSLVMEVPASLADIPHDKTTVSQSRLDIEDKKRSNLFPWNGQFSPQLISVFLEAYASSDDVLLDPFMGSGTVLVESASKGLAAFGADVNPAPFKIASLYRICAVGAERRRDYLLEIDGLLQELFPFALGKSQSPSSDDLKKALVEIANSQSEIQRVILEALIVLLDFYKPDLTEKRLLDTWTKLRNRIKELPFSRRPVKALNCDARSLPLKDGSIDLVVTSPPYINVFNYHQMYRASVEALGWNLLDVARSEIGSNRKHRGNRFLTVIQYCLDIARCFGEASRVCKDDARLIFIVGRESNVRKTAFFNGDIVTQIATSCIGLSAECRQERVFTNRFGTRIVEDILHFKNRTTKKGLKDPREVGLQALTEAKKYAPAESLDDLALAIDLGNEISESPLYEPQQNGIDE